MRRLRFIPEGGALVEVTCRTLHSRFLFRPGEVVNPIIAGVLGRAQRMYGVRVCSYVVLSNHFHLHLDVDDAHQLARFMGFVGSNLARKIGRLVGWREKIWSRRYEAIVISSEPQAQIERLRYVLANGVKEGLVERVSQWPGLHCANALLTGTPLEGLWFDATQAYRAQQKGKPVAPSRFTTSESLSLSPLPCWKHLPEEQRRKLVADLIASIELEAAERRRETGGEALGAAAVKGQHPFDRPRRSKKSPAPRFQAATQAVRLELYAAYGWFVACFREAAEKLRAGDRRARFPAGSFPPALPFVPA